jgi:hypothetical protein
MSKKTIVYWSVFSYPHLQSKFALYDLEPKSISSYIIKNRAKNTSPANTYSSCSSFKKQFHNGYYFNYPLTTEIKFDDNGNIIRDTNDANWYLPRESSLNNSNSADFDLGFLFFSEEDIEIMATPPYLHKTKTSETSFVTSGSFNISKWFRPVMLTHHTFPGHNSISTVEGEPSVYIFFDTENQIEFRKFVLNEKLYDYGKNCVELKLTHPFLSLEEMYTRFKNGKVDKMILKEIKENLVD